MKSKSYPYPFDEYIPTEETMFKCLEEKSKIDDSWVLHKLPLAHMINSMGVQQTQQVINGLPKEENKILVCQHILVDQLKVDGNTQMCSPHASEYNSVIPIPHYPVNTGTPQERVMLFGFLGSTSTHASRKGIVKLFPDCCKDSGAHWGLDKSLGDGFHKSYIDMLAKCEFALCPRGTGISSVRLFEAMAMGTIPVIIANGYRPPLSNYLNWSEFSVTISENKIKNIPQVLGEFTTEDISSMRQSLEKTYCEHFSSLNFHKSVEMQLC
jgi:hypothetical protein